MTCTFQKQAITLIDDLKGDCANYGLGNDGNEFKIITQICSFSSTSSTRSAKRGSSSSMHDGTMAEFEFEVVQIAVSVGLVDHPCNEVVESFD